MNSSSPINKPPTPHRPTLPLGPTEAEWARLSAAEQEQLERDLIAEIKRRKAEHRASLSIEERMECSEGEPHFDPNGAELSTKDEELAKLTLLIQQEQARAEQEHTRAEQEHTRAEQACAELAESILLMARLRGIALSEQAQAHIRAAGDLSLLSRWVQRAATFPPTAPPDDFFLDS